jgi:prepilin-type N-terminal cleavage/methylation domain-containing protein
MTIAASTPSHRETPFQRQKGFTLIELSITLLVIGLLLGAVAIGRDLQRSAANQRLSTDFVQGWQLAYEAYVNGVGRPPGDSATNPTGQVNGATAPLGTSTSPGAQLCEATMVNAFLAAGVRLPEGRTNGLPDRYVYLDSNGNPQEVKVCFQSVPWAEPGAALNAFNSRPRNVMVLTGVTFSLVAMLDLQIDGRSDARFGRLRDLSLANATATAIGTIWPLDDRMTFGTTTPNARDEDQVAVTTALFQMTR